MWSGEIPEAAAPLLPFHAPRLPHCDITQPNWHLIGRKRRMCTCVQGPMKSVWVGECLCVALTAIINWPVWWHLSAALFKCHAPSTRYRRQYPNINTENTKLNYDNTSWQPRSIYTLWTLLTNIHQYSFRRIEYIYVITGIKARFPSQQSHSAYACLCFFETA